MTSHVLPLLLTLFPIALIGALFPWMGRTRPGIVFGITVPLDYAASPEVQRLTRHYRLATGSISVVLLIVTTIVTLHNPAKAIPIAEFCAILLQLIAANILWVRTRRIVRQNAVHVPLERSAQLTSAPHGATPIVLMLSANLPILAEAIWLRLHWASIPARWPQHWNAEFVVDGWGVRSFASVFAPLLVGVMLVLFMAGIALFIRFASGSQPAQRRLILAPLAALAWMLASVFCLIGLLPIQPHISQSEIVMAVLTQVVLILAVVVWLAWRSGLSTAFSSKSADAVEPYDGTPDAAWRAGGLFYYNPSDAAVLVPKRFGWGWTLNMARPAAWVCVGVTLLVCVLSTLLPLVLK